MEEAARYVVRQDVEHSVLLSPTGEVVDTRIGDAGTVSLGGTPQERQNAVAVHNHRRGRGFSPEDVGAAMASDLRELQAVGTVNGRRVTYRMQRPAGGWPTNDRQQAMQYYAEAQGGAVGRYAHMTPEQVAAHQPHEAHYAMELLAARFRLGYSRTVE